MSSPVLDSDSGQAVILSSWPINKRDRFQIGEFAEPVGLTIPQLRPDIRRVLSGIDEGERQRLFADHRARLEARLDEVRSLLDAVDQLTMKGPSSMSVPMSAPTELTS